MKTSIHHFHFHLKRIQWKFRKYCENTKGPTFSLFSISLKTNTVSFLFFFLKKGNNNKLMYDVFYIQIMYLKQITKHPQM